MALSSEMYPRRFRIQQNRQISIGSIAYILYISLTFLEQIMATEMDQSYALGLDLGGTYVKAAVVSLSGEILDQDQVETPAERKVDDTVKCIVQVVNELAKAWPDIVGVGLGSPGLVDRDRKIVRLSPNFPAWRDVPLKEMVAAAISPPIFLENDVNCFALAEHRWGAGRGFENMLALTVGTGIGGAIIIHDQLYRGDSGAAGELGHVSVDLWGPKCACGNLGCVERYLGNQWFVAAAREALEDGSIQSPEQVSEMARKGDKKALKFIEDRGEILGVACTSFIHIFDPEAIIIGGGIAQSGEAFFRGINRSVKERAYRILADKVRILPAKLGTMAGAMGAAIIGFEAGSQR